MQVMNIIPLIHVIANAYDRPGQDISSDLRLAAACIEDLAAALKTFADKWANVENEREDDDSHFYMHTITIGDLRRVRATLERWGLK